MTTWTDFLADIRADLQDTSATARFSDKMLYIYAKDAIRDYSIWFPRRLDSVVISAIGASYPLPTNFIAEIQVECPVGTFLERRMDRPGSRFPNRKQNAYYFIQGGNLYTFRQSITSSLSDVYLTYLSTHAVPTSETDTTSVFTVPDADLELIRIYVKAQVYTQMRTRQSALDRFKNEGKRDDNPLEPETFDMMRDYRAKIAERFTGGYIALYKPGRAI